MKYGNLKKILLKLETLDENQLAEAGKYIDMIARDREEIYFDTGREEFVAGYESFDFLKEEENIYTVRDLKERYR